MILVCTFVLCSAMFSLAGVSFLACLLSFFLVQASELGFVRVLTLGIRLLLITATASELKNMRGRIDAHDDGAADPDPPTAKPAKFDRPQPRRLNHYCQMNIIFGLMTCVFQILAFMINDWFKDDVSAAITNLGFDVSFLGLSYRYSMHHYIP